MILRPYVSLILVADNDPTETLESLFNQNFADFEVLVLDRTGKTPTDNSKDFRVRWIPCLHDTLPKAYNQGVRESQGVVVGFLKDTIRWKPHTLEKLCILFLHSIFKRGFVYGALNPQTYEEWDLSKIKYRNIVPLHAALVRREAIERAGDFNENPQMLAYYEWDFWWRISKQYINKSIPDNLGVCYQNPPTLSTDRSWQKNHPRIKLRKQPFSMLHVMQYACLNMYQSPLFMTEKGTRPLVKTIKKWALSVKPMISAGLKTVSQKIRG